MSLIPGELLTFVGMASILVVSVRTVGGFRSNWRYPQFRAALMLLAAGFAGAPILGLFDSGPHIGVLFWLILVAQVGGAIGGVVLWFRWLPKAKKRHEAITACAEYIEQFLVLEGEPRIDQHAPDGFPGSTLVRLQGLLVPGDRLTEYPWLTREWVDAQLEALGHVPRAVT